MEHPEAPPGSSPAGEHPRIDSAASFTWPRDDTTRRIGSWRSTAEDDLGVSPEIARSCADALASGGPIALLACLNARTRFRFTGLYRSEPPNLLNLYLYDRENPTLDVSGEISCFDETYCAIVCAEKHPFATPNARKDVRLSTHAARESVLSYCGVPIRLATGVIWGTLCHFDVRPRLLPHSEPRVLLLVAQMLGSSPMLGARRASGSPSAVRHRLDVRAHDEREDLARRIAGDGARGG